MILVLGDLNGAFALVNDSIEHAEAVSGKVVSAVLQLGDFGLSRGPLRQFFGVPPKKRFHRPVYFMDGNHEDFIFFDRLAAAHAHCFTYLPRGMSKALGGMTFLCLGGAAYMDPVNTPAGAVIRGRDIDRCLAHGPSTVDVIVSHDCPRGIGVPGTPGFEYCGPTGFARSAELRARFTGKPWLFAHHHRWFELHGEDGNYYGLPEAIRGYALIDHQRRIRLVRR